MDATQDAITILLRQRHRAVDFQIRSMASLLEAAAETQNTLTILLGSIAAISLLVGGIGVMNIMLVAVTERTREIGVRRALGARRRTILMQFLIEASVVTLVGGLIGTVLGMGGAQLFALTTPVPAEATPQAVVLGILVSATVGIGFGTWPAWRAARLDPIESLRYE